MVFRAYSNPARHTLSRYPITARFTFARNHNQLDVFSVSTMAKATGKSWSFASAAAAVRMVTLYLPVRKVQSIMSTG